MKKEIHLAISITALVALLLALALLIYLEGFSDVIVKESVVDTHVIDTSDDATPDNVPNTVVSVEDENVIRDNDVSQPIVEIADGWATYTYRAQQWRQVSTGLSFTYPSHWILTEGRMENGSLNFVEITHEGLLIRIDQTGTGATPDWTYAYEIDGHQARTWRRQLEDGRFWMQVSPEETEFIFRVFIDEGNLLEVERFLSTIKFIK